jgi:hypothetical protein
MPPRTAIVISTSVNDFTVDSLYSLHGLKRDHNRSLNHWESTQLPRNLGWFELSFKNAGTAGSGIYYASARRIYSDNDITGAG